MKLFFTKNINIIKFSKGNDNILNIWSPTEMVLPKFHFEHHQAAVKAIAWCPFQSNLLASGGGTADRTIR